MKMPMLNKGATHNFGKSTVHKPTCEGSETNEGEVPVGETNEGEVPVVLQSKTRRSERIRRQNPKY